MISTAKEILTRTLGRKLDEKERDMHRFQESLREEMRKEVQEYQGQMIGVKDKLARLEETLLTLMKEMVALRLELDQMRRDLKESKPEASSKYRVRGPHRRPGEKPGDLEVRAEEDCLVMTRRR